MEQSLIGKTIDEARKLIPKKYFIRHLKSDQIITFEMNHDRINVYTASGKITKVEIG